MKQKVLILVIAFVVGFAIAMGIVYVFKDQLWELIPKPSEPENTQLTS